MLRVLLRRMLITVSVRTDYLKTIREPGIRVQKGMNVRLYTA